MKMKKWFFASVAALSILAASVTGTHAFAATTSSSPTEQNVINTAQAYIGKVHYKFGARNTNRLILDCSSFTQLVFQQNGISIPWGSRAQARIGTLVRSKSDLRVGDLVMFSIGKRGKISHVGIYIGNGQFINNQPGVGVNIKSLDNGFFKDRFIMGRHIV